MEGDLQEWGSLSFRIGRAPTSNPPSNVPLPSRRGRRGWQYPIGNIPWDPVLGDRMFRRISNHLDATTIHEIVQDDLEDFSEPTRSALHSFVVNLWAWGYAGGAVRALPMHVIAERSLREGPSFAKWLDGYKTYVLGSQNGWEFFDDEIPLSYLGVPVPTAKVSLSDIYRSNQLFPWTPPDPNLFDICFEEVHQDADTLNEFRHAVREWLLTPSSLLFSPLNDPTVAERDSTKKALEGAQWQLPPTQPATERGLSRIAYIPRELKESRAAIVCSYPEILTVRWIEQNVRHLLQTDRRSKMDTSPTVLFWELQKALLGETRYRGPSQKGRFFTRKRVAYCRDFKKEGLTKPRNILTIILEELSRAFPKAAAFSAPHFFEKWEFFFKKGGESYSPPRGHGLGMANALTTVMQIIIEIMVRKRSQVRPKWTGYVNDDAALIFEDREAAVKYAAADQQVCRELGLAFKKKSTFFSENSVVLCEVYVSRLFQWVNNRRSFGFQALANLTKACNASHARDMAASMNMQGATRNFVEDVLAYWGSVLYRNEHLRPRPAGGWFRRSLQGVDISYLDLPASVPLLHPEEAARRAYLETEWIPDARTHGKTFRGKRAKVYDNEWLIQRGEDLVHPIPFRPQDNAKKNSFAWAKFQEKLKRRFAFHCSRLAKGWAQPLRWQQVWAFEQDKAPTMDILPPPTGERAYVRVRWGVMPASAEIWPPYHGCSEQVDLNRWNAGIRDDVAYSRLMGPGQRKRLGGFTQNQRDNRKSHLLDPYKDWSARAREPEFIPVPDDLIMEQWHDPFAVLAVLEMAKVGIPNVPPTGERAALLDKRRRVYDTTLTPEEWVCVGRLPPDDRIVLQVLRDIWRREDAEDGIRPTLKEWVAKLHTLPKSMVFYHGDWSPLSVIQFLDRYETLRAKIQNLLAPRDVEEEPPPEPDWWMPPAELQLEELPPRHEYDEDDDVGLYEEVDPDDLVWRGVNPDYFDREPSVPEEPKPPDIAEESDNSYYDSDYGMGAEVEVDEEEFFNPYQMPDE